MKDNATFDSNLNTNNDKDTIRKNICSALINKSTLKISDAVVNADCSEKIPDLFKTFITRYRQTGGKFIHCTNENLTNFLIKLLQGQNYFTILSTNTCFKHHLDKYHINYTEAIDLSAPADAAILFSDMLIAANGSIGFTQQQSRYSSVKNLAKDLIVVSSTRYIYPDINEAMQHQHTDDNVAPAIYEFSRPELVEDVDGTLTNSPQSPRFILLLLDERQPMVQQQASQQVQPISQPEPQPNSTPEQQPVETSQN